MGSCSSKEDDEDSTSTAVSQNKGLFDSAYDNRKVIRIIVIWLPIYCADLPDNS